MNYGRRFYTRVSTAYSFYDCCRATLRIIYRIDKNQIYKLNNFEVIYVFLCTFAANNTHRSVHLVFFFLGKISKMYLHKRKCGKTYVIPAQLHYYASHGSINGIDFFNQWLKHWKEAVFIHPHQHNIQPKRSRVYYLFVSIRKMKR